jgi:hypothetical protein
MGAWALGYSYKTDRVSSRWLEKYQNVEDFDDHFRSLLPKKEHKTYNPWLRWFNNQFFARTDDLHTKYYNYAALTRSLNDWGNYIDNSYYFDVPSEYLYKMCRYYSDGVLPMGATMFTSGTEDGFYMPPSLSGNFPMNKWYPNSELYDYDQGTILVKGSALDHPDDMSFRFFWDYDHDQLLQGCCSCLSRAQVATLITESKTVSESSYPTEFYDETLRKEYVAGSIKLTTGAEEIVTDYRNPLTYDPVFMFIKMDLLNLLSQ